MPIIAMVFSYLSDIIAP